MFLEPMILDHASIVRLTVFYGVLVLMAVYECIAPRKKTVLSKVKRWISNLILVFLDAILVRFLIIMTPVVWATYLDQKGIGLLHGFSFQLRVGLAIVALDFVIYLQHVMFHFLPVLWRFHRVHHCDRDIDVSTGLRFHPVEILISLGIKFSAIFLLGAPPEAVLLFEIILNASAMFNHSNIKIPIWLDRVLRFVLVTPDMHRVHHSIYSHETNSNFGFNLPYWDFLCGTYIAQPQDGHQEMEIGLPEFRFSPVANLFWLLYLPFRLSK